MGSRWSLIDDPSLIRSRKMYQTCQSRNSPSLPCHAKTHAKACIHWAIAGRKPQGKGCLCRDMARAEETGRVEGTGSVLRLQPEEKGKWEGNGSGLCKWCQSLCIRTPMEMEGRRQLHNHYLQVWENPSQLLNILYCAKRARQGGKITAS